MRLVGRHVRQGCTELLVKPSELDTVLVDHLCKGLLVRVLVEVSDKICELFNVCQHFREELHRNENNIRSCFCHSLRLRGTTVTFRRFIDGAGANEIG